MVRPTPSAVAGPDAAVELGGSVLPYDPAELRALMVTSIETRPDGRDSALRLLVAACATTLGVLLVRSGPALLVVGGVVVLSLVFASMVSAQHECCHRALFARRGLNDALGLAIGAVAVIPYAGYRSYHLHHHAHTHDPQDSEPVTVGRSVAMWAATIVGAFHFVRMVSVRWLPMAFRSRSRRTVRLAWLSAAGLVAGMAVLVWFAVSQPRAFLLVWLVPLLVGTCVNGWLTLPEHYGCGYGPADAVVTTRTVTSNGFGRLLAWNANFHAEHHWAPGVPTCRLPELHVLLAPYVAHHEPGYLRYHRDVLGDVAARRYPPDPPWSATELPD